MPLTTVFLGLGSNIERERHLHAGLEALTGFVRNLRCSPVFESEPLGIRSGPFINLVVTGETELPLAELSLRLKHIEADNGRYAPERKGLPLDIDEAVAVIARGFRRRIDLGEVNGHVFVNNSSIGFYPFLVSQREALRRRHGVSKLLATIPALWRGFRDTGWRLLTITATLDARPVRTPCLFVGNNVYDLENFGRRQHLDRGELGVCVVRGRSRLRMLRLPLLALGRKLDEADEIDRFTCRELHLESHRRALHVALDGEVLRLATPLHYRTRPGAMMVIAPRDPP